MPEPQLINLEYAGRQFDFQVHQRDLLFGSAGPGKYYWMDGRQLSQGRAGPNFRPVVDFWWHAVEEADAADEIYNQTQLVFAECYPLVNTAKAVQDVYVDAHLHRTADREYTFEDEAGVRICRSERTYLLPDDECARLREVAHSRVLDRIREELEGLFLGDISPTCEMPAFDEAAQAWIGNGIVALRRDGHEGLWRYTQTVDDWICRLRRRGGIDRVRQFLNMFSYECKVAFYGCYCSAWVAILQRLGQNREPNAVGERFMQLWHNQNRVSDDAEVRRDVFCGQILALHPLSAVVLTSPQHLAVIGRWFGHPEYEAILSAGKIADCPEYWDLVTTILIAAHEYDQSRRRWEGSRNQTTLVSTESVDQHPAGDSSVFSPRIAFEDFAAARQHQCPACSAHLTYLQHETRSGQDPTVIAEFRCSSCQREKTIEIRLGDVEE